jgi:hypothetical protein
MWRLLTYLTILLACISLNMRGQNLVPNNSFENVIGCIDSGGAVNQAINWSNPSIGTPDIHAVDFCNTYFYSVNISLPNNPYFGYQQPRTGLKCAGIAVFSEADNVREYLQVNLLDTLKAGNNYCVEFYVSLANKKSQYAIKDLSLHFNSDSIFSDSTYNIYYDDRNITSTEYITDTLNWTKISGVYHASGGEKYIVLGNFKPKFETDDTLLYPNVVTIHTYYFIDDISIYECDTVLGVTENLIDNIQIYPNPAQDYFVVDAGNFNNIQVELFDISGRKLLQQKITTNQEQVYVSGLASGVYICWVSSGSQVVKRQKLIIQK